MSYGNGHERKCLNRFSLLEHTALPAMAALGLGRPGALLAGARGQRLWAVQRDPVCPACLQPALLLSSPPKTITTCQPGALSTPGAPYPVPWRCPSLSAEHLQEPDREPTQGRLFQKLQHLGSAEGRDHWSFRAEHRVSAHAKTCSSCFKLG